ncbi:MAG: adenylate kinase [Chloroflexi bacterium]|nr:adenylate kinase [Chloroflexota bacterium]MBI5828398.1 adenylate kinase [Chloroflexota bacterium]
MPVYLVLIGLPGAGKGTQAALLSKQHGLAHVSSGDLFRDNIKRQTPLGQQVEAILKRGDLVPDDVTIAMVRDRLKNPECARGAVLDGFPRTPAQAKALEAMLTELGGRVNLVPYIQVSEPVLVERLTGRWTCKGPGQHVYHLKFNPPKAAGVCDVDGTELFQRPDDREETVKNRIAEYVAKTSPLIEHYRSLGLLVEINGDQAIEPVTAQLLAAVAGAK